MHIVQSDGRAKQWIKGFANTLRFSPAARSPPLFDLSSPNTESLNQGAAVFSARIMYGRTVLSHRPAYIVPSDQYQCEIAEFSNGDDWPRPAMTQSSSETLSKDFLLIGRNVCLSQQISLNSTMKFLGAKLIEVFLWFCMKP